MQCSDEVGKVFRLLRNFVKLSRHTSHLSLPHLKCNFSNNFNVSTCFYVSGQRNCWANIWSEEISYQFLQSTGMKDMVLELDGEWFWSIAEQSFGECEKFPEQSWGGEKVAAPPDQPPTSTRASPCKVSDITSQCQELLYRSKSRKKDKRKSGDCQGAASSRTSRSASPDSAGEEADQVWECVLCSKKTFPGLHISFCSSIICMFLWI